MSTREGSCRIFFFLPHDPNICRKQIDTYHEFFFLGGGFSKPPAE